MQSPSKHQQLYFYRKKADSKLYIEIQSVKNNQDTLENSKVGGLTLHTYQELLKTILRQLVSAQR